MSPPNGRGTGPPEETGSESVDTPADSQETITGQVQICAHGLNSVMYRCAAGHIDGLFCFLEADGHEEERLQTDDQQLCLNCGEREADRHSTVSAGYEMVDGHLIAIVRVCEWLCSKCEL